MRFKYYFCELHSDTLIDWLEKNKVRYKLAGGGMVPRLVSFSIWSSGNETATLLLQLEKMNTKKPIIYAEYTPAELANAKLLMVTPRKQIIDIINSQEAYDYSCRWVNSFGIKKVKHEKQRNLFVIEKEPSTNTQTAFWAPDTGFAEIFTDLRIHDLVVANNLKGVELKHVLTKHGGVSSNIYQMTSPCIISRNCLQLGYGEKITHCPVCGKEQFFIDNAYKLHLDYKQITDDSDLYITERIFGEGIAYPLYLISQRFYRLIKENKLAANMTFSPVVGAD